MSWFWINWLIGALLLCWAVGAYNRLVRLRSACVAAFAALTGCWTQQVAWLESNADTAVPGAASDMQGAPAQMPGPKPFSAANHQFASVIASAKNQPMNPAAVASLALARAIAESAWQTHDHAAAKLPAGPQARGLQRLDLECEQAREAFNAAVAHYNRARLQWPTWLVAALFNFGPAKGL